MLTLLSVELTVLLAVSGEAGACCDDGVLRSRAGAELCRNGRSRAYEAAWECADTVLGSDLDEFSVAPTITV